MFLYWLWLLFVKFWRFPEGLGKSRNPRWRIQDGRHLAIILITTSYDVITSRYGPQRRHLWTYYLSFKSYCHSFYTCEVIEGRGRGGGGCRNLPRSRRHIQEKPGKDRFKVALCRRPYNGIEINGTTYRFLVACG